MKPTPPTDARKRLTALLAPALLTLIPLGCANHRPTMPDGSSPQPTTPSPTLDATFLPGPVALDDPRWSRVQSLDLTPNAPQLADGLTLREPGRFQLAHNHDALFLRVDFTDTDLVCTATHDGDELYTRSDLAEWFIGPPPTLRPDGTLAGGWYLELHASPAGLRTAYLWSRPRLFVTLNPPPFELDLQTRGTLNDFTDTDDGWSALLTMPWSALQQIDPTLTRHTPLSVLIARYNYGHLMPYDDRGQAGPELSMHPPQPRTAFHLRPFHSPLRLLPPTATASP